MAVVVTFRDVGDTSICRNPRPISGGLDAGTLHHELLRYGGIVRYVAVPSISGFCCVQEKTHLSAW